MINNRDILLGVASGFKGAQGEPDNDVERYILKAMWVMMLSEFEGSVKDLANAFIDKTKKTKIGNIHICLLLQNFYPNREEGFTIDNIINIYKKNPEDINYYNFTADKKPKIQSKAVEKLFNNLGVFFSVEELAELKKLDSIASTRNSIAHGDSEVSITRKELESRFGDLENIYLMLRGRLT